MNREVRPSGQQADKPLVLLPYVRGVTEKVTRAIKPFAKVATRPEKNFLVKPKGKRELDQNSGLVYQYECECKKVYIYRGNVSEHKDQGKGA